MLLSYQPALSTHLAVAADLASASGRLYRAGEGLKTVTKDHLWVTRLVREGILKPDDLYTHPRRNIIERALCTKLPVEVDIFTVPLRDGDTLLLCSPGLWKMLRDSKIEDVISHTLPNASKAAEALIQAALDSGGKDNISAIVVSMLATQNELLVPGMQLFANPNTLHLPQV